MDHEYLTTNLTELKEYATFKTQHDMDEAIYTYIEQLRNDEQPESVIEVLRFFGRSSLRVLGVSFAKYDTIATSIGYSKRTVIRAVKTLTDYGMIAKIPTLKRWVGALAGRSLKRSVNVVTIVPNAPMSRQSVTSDKPAEPTPGNESNVDTQAEPIIHNQQELLHKPYRQDTYLSQSADAPYTRFKSLISDKKLRNKIYGIWLAQTSYIRDQYDADTLLTIGIRAVMTTFKSRKAKSLTGYYNGVLDRMLDSLHYDTITEYYG